MPEANDEYNPSYNLNGGILGRAYLIGAEVNDVRTRHFVAVVSPHGVNIKGVVGTFRDLPKLKKPGMSFFDF